MPQHETIILLTARTRFRLDPEGRSAKHTHWSDTNAPNQLTVFQVLIDRADQYDWEATFTIDLAACRSEYRAALRFDGVQPID